jgi:hypothetical protein
LTHALHLGAVAVTSLVALSCGRAVSPVPAASATTTAPAASSTMTVTGALALNIVSTHTAPPCGSTPGGFVAELQFDSGGRTWAVSIQLPEYSKPGTYQAPPAKVSVRTLGYGNGAPVFYGGTSGTIVVDPSGTSGTVDEQLAGQGGTAHLTGTWRCG